MGESPDRSEFMQRSKKQTGFTLIEALIATVLVAVGVVAALQGIVAVQRGQAHVQDADLLQRLAAEKLNDLRYQSDPSQLGTGGNYLDRGYPNIDWSATVASTSVDNVDQVTVTATKGTESESLTTMIYVQPTTTTSTTSTSAT